MNNMHSLSFRAIGTLTRHPDVVTMSDRTLTQICLVMHDDETMTVWFIAAGSLGAEIGEQARRGDQLIVEGIIIRDFRAKGIGSDCDFCFLVKGYRFGARRQPPGARAEATVDIPPHNPSNDEEVSIAVA